MSRIGSGLCCPLRREVEEQSRRVSQVRRFRGRVALIGVVTERLEPGARCLPMFDASRRSELERIKVAGIEHLDKKGNIT